eukprot:CAMPEP_0117587846 /NCGR_PEP_ID=MMETSP0784-20121206/69527_1 /TAXON_ID=39447 /ORGANISM="" /LENGTH=45 /DNA_ID= /DNA_START= /DNA_END= /DNA_ORIENTATION=
MRQGRLAEAGLVAMSRQGALLMTIAIAALRLWRKKRLEERRASQS